ncbi:MAG TPA: autotransporter-associated beta strand repeat-containing protein, partial [Pirellulales bacterium]|nr:autotransporter-associated beta strand repeat-containing protein [Pirellulales bacterium]
SYAGAINGAAGLVSSGALTLAGANGYTGTTTISGGTLNVTGSLASTDIRVASGAALSVANALVSGANLTSAGAVAFAGSQTLSTLNGSGGSLSFAGNLSVGSGSYAGSLSGTGELVKNTASALTLAGGTFGYTGGTQLNAGTVALANPALGGASISLGAFGSTITFNGGVLADYAGSFTISNALFTSTTSGGFYVDNGLTVTATGTISGNSSLTKLGSGTLILLGQNNSTAPIIVDGGTISGNASSFGNNPIELSGGGTVVFDQSSGAGTFANTITGAGNVVIDGTLTLTNPNSSYSGITTLNAANLTIANGGDLGTQGLAMNGSTVNSGNGSYGAATTLSGTNLWNVAAGGTFTDTGAMNGSGSFTKAGLGTFVAGAASSFSGGLTVASGSFNVTADKALGTGSVTVSSGASLGFVSTGNYTGTNSITAIGRGVSNSGAVQFSGNNSFGGNITVGGATGASASIGLAGGSNVTLAGVLSKDGRTLEFDANGANVHVNITGTLTGGSAGSDVIFNGNNVSTADFTISTAQTYNGPTYVTNGSTLFLGASNVLPSSPHTDLTLTSTGAVSTFNLSGFSDTVRVLAGDANGVVTNTNTSTISTLTVAPTAAGYASFAGSINGNLNVAFGGAAGTAEVLTGTSSYSGATNVNSGALLVNGSLTSGGTVTVNSSASGNPGILAGIGTVTGNVMIAGDGTSTHNGVLSPGNTIPDINNPDNSHVAGLLHVAGNLTVSGTYLWDLTAATNSAAMAGVAYDQVALGGHSLSLVSVGGHAPTFELNLAGGAHPTAGGFWGSTEVWNVITGLTANPGSQFALSLAEANTWSSLGSFSLQYSSGAEQLIWTPTSVPEPGTMLLGALAAAGLGVRGWRRRRNAKAQAADQP